MSWSGSGAGMMKMSSAEVKLKAGAAWHVVNPKSREEGRGGNGGGSQMITSDGFMGEWMGLE